MNAQPNPSVLNLWLHRVALAAVGLGALVGIVASVIAWSVRGEFATTTFVTSIVALMAAYPVWRDYRSM